MIRTDAAHRPSRAVVRRELRAVAAALVTALLVAGAAGAGARAAAAAEPVLDPAYGVNGRAAAGFTDVLGVDAATDGAGRRVVLGQQLQGFEQVPGAVWLVRFTPAGVADPSFGPAGRVPVTVPAGTVVEHLTMGSDGRLTITGRADRDIVVIRLTPAGVPDGTFAGDGLAIIATGLPDEYVVTVRAATESPLGGMIIAATGLAEFADPQLFAGMVFQLTLAGAPDPSFGTAGRAVLPDDLATTITTFGGLTLFFTHEIALTFTSVGEGGEEAGVLRLTAGGEPDAAFGTGGVSRAINDAELANLGLGEMREGPAGSLVVAGYTATGFLLARLLADGTRDTGFGTGGFSVVPGDGCTSTGAELTGDEAGRFWVSHTRGCGVGGAEFARFLGTGYPDMTFGTNGYLSLHYNDVAPGAAPFSMGGGSLHFDASGGVVFGAGSRRWPHEGDETVDVVSWRLPGELAPAVVAHPANRTAVTGRTVSFVARAAGRPTPTVQWQTRAHAGAAWVAVPGATATTLTVRVAVTLHRRQYRAVFSNVLDTAESAAATLTVAATRADYTGDGRTDIAVYRPSTGTWYVRGADGFRYGVPGDVPVVGDFTGDAKADLTVFRPSTGDWHVRGLGVFRYGVRGDVPVPGDFTGDGRAEIAVYRPATGIWYFRGIGAVRYGDRGDVPLTGDFTGDGRAEIAVYRPSTGTWYFRGIGAVRYGDRGDVPLTGDFTGDGRAEIATYRPSTGLWSLRGVGVVRYGSPGDVPLTGDFTGDGRTDIAVYRPSRGLWLLRGIGLVQYGNRGDHPLVR